MLINWFTTKGQFRSGVVHLGVSLSGPGTRILDTDLVYQSFEHSICYGKPNQLSVDFLPPMNFLAIFYSNFLLIWLLRPHLGCNFFGLAENIDNLWWEMRRKAEDLRETTIPLPGFWLGQQAAYPWFGVKQENHFRTIELNSVLMLQDISKSGKKRLDVLMEI